MLVGPLGWWAATASGERAAGELSVTCFAESRSARRCFSKLLSHEVAATCLTAAAPDALAERTWVHRGRRGRIRQYSHGGVDPV